MPELKTEAAPVATDPLKGLTVGRVVYFWESVMNKGLAECPAIVVEVRRNTEGKRNGSVRLFCMYTDGSDGTKADVMFSEKPATNRWTWPMNADGSPNRD